MSTSQDGSLSCEVCHLTYAVVDGLVLFGVRREGADQAMKEVEAEYDWHFASHELTDHLAYLEQALGETAHLLEAGLKHCAPERRALRVLDAGSGAGAFSYLLASLGHEVVAIDISPESLASGKAYADRRWFLRTASDITALPIASSSADLVLCREAAHHIPDMELLFSEFRRVLMPGGVLVMIEPFRAPRPVANLAPEYDGVRDAGITHQTYSLADYLTALSNTGIYPLETSIRRFRPDSHRLPVRVFRGLERVIGANTPTRGHWFKRFAAIFLDGAVNFVAVAQGPPPVQRRGGRVEMALFTEKRLQDHRTEIEWTRDNIRPFLELLDTEVANLSSTVPMRG